MTGRIHRTAIKRSFLLCMALTAVLTLFSGCGSSKPETAPSESGEQAASTVSNEDVKVIPLPADLLSDALNVFSSVSFPDDYCIYAAGFENGGDCGYYSLYLTAQGKPEDIITYISTLVGDKENTQVSIDYYLNHDQYVAIPGTQTKDGLNADCTIEAAKEGDYDYDYVDGCVLRLRAKVDDPSAYIEILTDNYNLNSLCEVADYFAVTPVTGLFKIYVRKSQNDAKIDAVYNTVEDVASVMENMKDSLSYDHFDENIPAMNLTAYGEVSNNIFFDVKSNSISIFQTLRNAKRNYKNYQPTATKLTDYGFINYIETDALCNYRDDKQDLDISINVPDWGSRPNEWENSCVTFSKGINGYLLLIWYYPDGQTYTVQADKDDTSAKFVYDEKADEFVDEFSTTDTVREQFINMFADSAQDDVYRQCIELYKNDVHDTFGMSIDDLYAMASGE